MEYGHRGCGRRSIQSSWGSTGLRGGKHAVEALGGPKSPAPRGQEAIGFWGQGAAAWGRYSTDGSPAHNRVQCTVYCTLELLQELGDWVIRKAARGKAGKMALKSLPRLSCPPIFLTQQK